MKKLLSLAIISSLFLLNSCSVLKKALEEPKEEPVHRYSVLNIPENLGMEITFKGDEKFPDIQKQTINPELEQVKKLEGHEDSVNSIKYFSNGRKLVSGSSDRTVRIWDVRKGKQVKKLEGHGDYVMSVDITKDNKFIASASWDGSINIWKKNLKEPLLTIEGGFSYINSVAFSPTDRIIAAGGTDKKVFLFDYELGEIFKTFEGHTDAINSVAFSPDGKFLASGSSDTTVIIWDVYTGKAIRILQGHRDSVKSVAFSPDGKLLASGSWDSTIKVWNVKTGKLLRTLKGNELFVNAVDFSHDGKFLVSAHWNNTVVLWDVKTGRKLKKFDKFLSFVNTVQFSPNDRYIAAGSNDATIRILKVTEGFYPFITATKVKVQFRNGRKAILPKGTFVSVDVVRNEIIIPETGKKVKLISGEIEPLYIPTSPVIIFKNTTYYKSPKLILKKGIIPAGIILDKNSILFTKDKKLAYVHYKKYKGWIKTDNIAKIERVKKFFILTSNRGYLYKKVDGTGAEKLPEGVAFESEYYIPYLKKYYVKSVYGNGWISEDYLSEINYEPVDKTFVTLPNTVIYVSPFLNEEIGILKEGYELKPEAKITIGNESYYYIELSQNSSVRCKKACMGYVKAKNLRELKKSLQKRLWTKRTTTLYLSPTGTRIIRIPKHTKVIPESLTNKYYKVKVSSSGIKGWIKRKDLTSIEPKGKKSKLSYQKPVEHIKKETKPKYNINQVINVEKPKPKRVVKRYQSQASKVSSYYEKVRNKEAKKSKNITIKGIVVAERLNLRVKPDPTSTILAVIPRGYVVTILGEKRGKWIKVSYYSRTKKKIVIGWVLRKYVQY